MGDRLKLIDALDDLRMQMAIMDMAPHTGMLQRDRPSAGAGNAHELKLSRFSWMATGGETMGALRFVPALRGVLEGIRWSVYASIDQKAQTDVKEGDLDTWYCAMSRDRAPGLPVYDR